MAITYVDSGSYVNNAGGTTVAASAINAATGNLIVVFVSGYATYPNAAVSGVADTAGNTYTKAGSDLAGLDINQRLSCWYASNVTANASNVVTATYEASSTFRAILVVQYSGIDTASPYDTQGARTYESSTTTTHTTASATNAVASALCIGFFVVYDAAYAMSVSGANNLRVSSANLYAAVDQIVASSGSQAATLLTATANKATTCMWIFSGAASTTVVPVFLNQYRQRVA